MFILTGICRQGSAFHGAQHHALDKELLNKRIDRENGHDRNDDDGVLGKFFDVDGICVFCGSSGAVIQQDITYEDLKRIQLGFVQVNHGREPAVPVLYRIEQQHNSHGCLGNGDVDSPLKAEELVKQTGCDAVMVGRAVRGNPWLFRELNHYFRTGELLERPSVEEIREMILRHARKQIELKGEFVGIREMRKHVAWYTAGMRHSAGLRRESNTIESYEALEELLSRLG